MEDVERQEDHYRYGGVYSRHRPQRLLQRLHEVTKGIDGTLYDHGGTQVGQVKDKLQVF